MMYTTVLHGGVCHRASAPHNTSGNKMKEKKNVGPRGTWGKLTNGAS